jgi:hypothetical protein
MYMAIQFMIYCRIPRYRPIIQGSEPMLLTIFYAPLYRLVVYVDPYCGHG